MKCPKCGFEDNAAAARPWKNSMHTYVNADGTAFGILNEDADTLTIPANAAKGAKEVVVTREDIFAAQQKQSAQAASLKEAQAQASGSKVPVPKP